MGRLLSQSQAAKRIGISRDKFRAICRSGQGPRVFDPLDGGRPMFVDTAVDEWLHQRDDRDGHGSAA